jgi:hypothetical protein
MPYQTLNETKGGVTFSSEIFSKFCSYGFVMVPDRFPFSSSIQPCI